MRSKHYYGLNVIDQIHTQIRMKVMQTESGRQTARGLIIYRRTCAPAILFWAYSYAGPSNFGRFGEMFWRIIRPLREALLWAKGSSTPVYF